MGSTATLNKKPLESSTYISIILVLTSLMVGGLPAYISNLQKPNRTEVSNMIQKEAPLSVSTELKQISAKLTEIQVTQASLHASQTAILRQLKK